MRMPDDSLKPPCPRDGARSYLAIYPISRLFASLLGFSILLACGCTTPLQYVRNGFKVGPNYEPPDVQAAKQWIDAGDVRIRSNTDDLSRWWKVFNDPVLDKLVSEAYAQNLSLKEAGYRILEARSQLGITIGNIMPQTQNLTGGFTRTELTKATANNFLSLGIPGEKRNISQWNLGFNLAWELDFWGRFRRAIESDSASLDASVENYDDVLVTLLSDLATNYVQLRTIETQLEYTRKNVELLRETLKLTEARYRAKTFGELDVQQAKGTLAQTQAQIPELEISARQYKNQLCILLGIPPEDLRVRLGSAPIPTSPADVAMGIPADLLRRRPDVRKAERLVAAQSAQIGLAESDLYPHISIAGSLGYSTQFFTGLLQERAFMGNIGPTFQWNILNYGRFLNNRRLQDAKFRELIATYQKTVLTADQEAENGLAVFLRAQERAKFQADSVDAAEKSTIIVLAQYKAGTVDYTRVTQILQNQVDQQNLLAQAKGEIARGLIQVYKALGGGWQLRETGSEPQMPILGAPVEN